MYSEGSENPRRGSWSAMMMMGDFLPFGGASCSLFAVVGVWKILRHDSCAGHQVKVIQMSTGRVMVFFGSRARRL